MILKNYLLIAAFWAIGLTGYAQATFNPEVLVGSSSIISRVADLDGDGKPDLVSGSYSNVSVFRNTSTGSDVTSDLFSDPLQLSNNNSKAINIQDVDGDGKQDVIVFYADTYTAGGIKVYKNTSTSGTISFDPAVEVTFTTTQYLTSGVVADFNNDGVYEAAAGTPGTTFIYTINSSGGISFTSAGTLATNFVNRLQAADIDGDGMNDLVANFGGVKVFRSTSTASAITFAAPVTIQTEEGNFSLADIDGDGKVDFAAIKKYYQHVFIRKNTSTPGTITFAPVVQLSKTSADGSVLLTDVNNDTHSDLVVLNKKNVWIYLNAGNGLVDAGTFPNADQFYLLQEAKDLYAADVNSDGLLDLLLTEYYYSGTAIMRNTTGLAATITEITPGGGIEGDEVVISGTGFSAVSSENIVKFGNIAADIISSTETEIVVTVPAGVVKELSNVYVINNGIYSAPYKFVALAERSPISWTTMGGNTYVDWVSSLSKDQEGNVYMAGGFYYNNFVLSGDTVAGFNGTNGLVAKLDLNGNVLFANSFSGKSSNISHGDGAADIAVDADGNAYVTGNFATDNYTSGPSADFGGIQVRSRGQQDVFLSKTDANGNVLWVQTGGSTNKGGTLFVGDLGQSVTIDNAGNIYVYGSFVGTAIFGDQQVTASNGRDLFIAKYTPSGGLLWVKSFPGSSDEIAGDLVADKNGSLYMAGNFSNSFTLGATTLTSAGSTDAFFAKLDTSANVTWVKQISGTAGEGISEISYVSSEGKVYLGGTYSGVISADGVEMTGGGSYLVGWDSEGEMVLSKNLSGVTLNGIDNSENGHLYLTGYFMGSASFDGMLLTVKNEFSAGVQDVFVVKLNNQGEVISLFSPQNNMTSMSSAAGSDIVVLPFSIAIGGTFSNLYGFKDTIGVSKGAEDIFIAKMTDENITSSVYSINLTNPAGGELWYKDSAYTISWESSAVNNVKLEYTTNNGLSWSNIASSVAASTGTYSWRVPNIAAETPALVRVSSVEQPSILDISSQFTLTKAPPIFKITYPNGGESLAAGSSVVVTYLASEASYVNFEYSIDGGTNWVVINNWQGASSKQYTWVVPEVSTSSALLRITDSFNTSIKDTSDAVFSITDVTAIANSNAHSFAVYPNPAKDRVLLSFVKKGTYEIVDMDGKTVISGSADAMSVDEINTNRLSSGIYIVKFKTAGEQHISKLIINK